MRRLFLILVAGLMILTACHASSSKTASSSESKEPFVIQVYYRELCPYCKQIISDWLPELETVFQDQMQVELYNLDDDGSIEKYRLYVGDYDPDSKTWITEGLLANTEAIAADMHLGNTWAPLVIVGQFYAFFGYHTELKEAYTQDIHLALQGRNLGVGDVSQGRYLFK